METENNLDGMTWRFLVAAILAALAMLWYAAHDKGDCRDLEISALQQETQSISQTVNELQTESYWRIEQTNAMILEELMRPFGLEPASGRRLK
jgi:hypothetical protein